MQSDGRPSRNPVQGSRAYDARWTVRSPGRTDIAIIGAGFSGSLLALHLLRKSKAVRVFLIERAAAFGRGLAYASTEAGHLLNVRAGNMSAFPEEPDHFMEWLAKKAEGAPPSFASRQLFGSYLQDLLSATVKSEAASGRLVVVPDEATELVEKNGRLAVKLDLGLSIEADQVVLATGNLPPHDPRTMEDDVRQSDAYIRDPWTPDAFARLRPHDDVLLIGSGLTAIDMIVKLASRGHKGRITALSRRGLRPHPHAACHVLPTTFDVPARPCLSELVRLVRARAATEGWRAAVDGLRPHTQRLWREASAEERRRFLRHLRPWWDVHRHRLAPSVASGIARLQAAGQVSVIAGRIRSFCLAEGKVDVAYRPRRRTATEETIAVDRVVTCTGPAGNLQMTRSHLLAGLMHRGMARADACGLGLDIDAECQLIGVDGRPNPNVLAIGPMSRGAFWEITAVPDIRVQAVMLAERLAAQCERNSQVALAV